MKTQIVSLSLPHTLVKTVDTFTQNRGMSRSDLFRSAALRYLESEQWRGLQERVRVRIGKRLPSNDSAIEGIVDSVRR
jgi:metal-responsive CopG/Arc/MetJ family transcriptional regulator